MQIELRDEFRHRIGRIDVDPAQRPTRVVVADDPRSWALHLKYWFQQRWGRMLPRPIHPPAEIQNPKSKIQNQSVDHPSPISREAFLTWETALDDAGQLRRCVACGCTELFKEKAFPVVTGFIVVLAFIGAIVGALGLANNVPVLLAMAGVLALDVATLVLSRRRLVCYRCRTTYRDLSIARYHRPWDRAVADRYPGPAAPAGERSSIASSLHQETASINGAPKSATASPATAHKGYFA